MKRGTANILATMRRGASVFVCLTFMLGVIAGDAVKTAYASHEDLTVLADADGALDDDAHVEGIHTAMRENWLAAWMMMTEQFVTTMMHQMFIVGTFFDAKQELEIQRLYQELTAEAHKDFHPSWQMCEFGTTVRSLSASEMVARENMQMLDQMLEKREHLNANLVTAAGPVSDVASRIRQFKDIYCDSEESNRMVALLCVRAGSRTDPVEGTLERRTKDIDYTRLLEIPYTLDANYADEEPTETEQDIFAFSRHIYSSPILSFVPEQLANESAGQDIFLETRSIHAIRSVARRSFTHMIGEKAEGDQNVIWNVRPYIYGIITELGVPEAELQDFLGENPSYFAQMEVLMRKIYQSPEFFTNLYDKPANVKRIGVALQALEIMQDRDRYEGALRREMLISLILELKIRAYQEDVTNAMFSSVPNKPGRARGPNN